MDTERNKRAMRLFKGALSVILIGAAYYVIMRLTGLSVPCPFKLITGKYCPGCGVTRMASALIRFDLKTAFQSNMFIMILLPLLIVWGIYKSYKYIRFGSTKQTKAESAAILITALASIAFAVLRNTESFAFMQP